MRIVALALAFTLVACAGGEDSDHEHEVGPLCEELGTACHDLGESGNAEAQECHELGHAGDEAACEAEHTACLAICSPT